MSSSPKISISKSSMIVKKNGVVIENLSPLLFKLLHYLSINKDVVISREKIIENVWGTSFLSSRNVDVQITKLRKLFDAPGSTIKGTSFHTVPGIGYRFSGNVIIEDEGKEDINIEVKHNIKMNYPYRTTQNGETMVVPMFFSESKYGTLVTYTKLGTMHSMPVNDFLSNFVE